MLAEARKLRTPQLFAALALDLNTGLRDKELREIRWEQIDLLNKKTLTVSRSKTDAGTGRVIPLNDTAVAALMAVWSKNPYSLKNKADLESPHSRVNLTLRIRLVAS